MEKELENELDDREFRILEQNYGMNNLKLTIAMALLERWVANPRIQKYLAQNFPDHLAQFQRMLKSANLG